MPVALVIPAKPSKYRAVKTVRHGITFDSKGEADRYDVLLGMLERGEIRNLRRQVRWPLCVDGIRIAYWRCDFYYQDMSDEWIVEDFKGRKTPLYNRSKKHFEAQYKTQILETFARPQKKRTRVKLKKAA